jgi:hypothetical protein
LAVVVEEHHRKRERIFLVPLGRFLGKFPPA